MSWVCGVKNFSVTPQTVGASTLSVVAKACGTFTKSKAKYSAQCVGLIHLWFYLPVPLSISQAYLKPAVSSEHLQPPERQPFWIKANNLRLAHGSLFQSMSCGQLENPGFCVFLWLPAHLSQLINLLQLVRTSRVWRHEGQSGNGCFYWEVWTKKTFPMLEKHLKRVFIFQIEIWLKISLFLIFF